MQALRPSTIISASRFNTRAFCHLAQGRPSTQPGAHSNSSVQQCSSILFTQGFKLTKPNRYLFGKSVQTMASGAAAGSAKRVLVPIANGNEEMEAVIVIDVLRRAGADVVVASVEDSLQVKCARGTNVVADTLLKSLPADEVFDLIVLPGGMPGAERLRDCEALISLVRRQKDEGRLYAAVCASPVVVFEAKGLLPPGAKATAHPGFSRKLKDQGAVLQRVVVDGNLTTSRGPGTTFEFALTLVQQLYGEEKMQAVAAPLVMYPFYLPATSSRL